MEKAERQRYRKEFQIIMKILECIIVESRQGKCYQTRIEQFANLQTEMRKFYLEKLENAGYVKRLEGTWGRRPVNYYVMTEKGLERFRTLQTIEDELNPKKEGSKGK
ncbi:MAG TPA: winged helix-turn-helix domain-containing protein [Candidatus Bathyarchaeia archaeon]|nr:winged helix-turn-helix domain-containing protein [Candidatus Bathyarchaeia archaeon]